MVPQLSASELWFGRGIGATFRTGIGNTGFACSAHIGIFTFLLKFGLPVFVCLVFFLYIYLPWKYIQSVIGFGMRGPSERAALLMAMPAVFSWVAILSMSGGFGSWSFVGAGLAYATFQKLRQGEGVGDGRPNSRGDWREPAGDGPRARA